MEFRDYLGVLRKYWVSIVVFTLLGLAAASAYIYLAPPVYTSSATVYLSVNGGSSSTDLIQSTNYASAQARSFAQMATMPQVLDPVIADLNLNTSVADLAKNVTATIPTNTQLITVAAKAGTAVRSAEIAQHTAESLVAAVSEISPLDANSRPVMVGNIVAPAMVPDGRTSPQLVLSLVLGLVAGLVVGVGLAILRKALDVRLHSSHDVTALTKYPVIATVPRDPSLVNDPVVMMTAPASVTGERYRQLRTNLRFFSIDSDRSRTFAVTSSIEGEGKTVTAINVAYALAEGGDRVLLIDADLRRPRVADYLGLEGSVGLTSILVDHVPLFNVIQQLGRNSPDVLTAGTTPANPAGLIGSRRMQQLLEQVAGEYKTIVIDAAPVLPVADTLALLPFITGTVVVAAADKVTTPQLKSALDSIERTGTQIVGITLNKERHQRGHSSYYGYGYAEQDQTRRSKRSGGRHSA